MASLFLLDKIQTRRGEEKEGDDEKCRQQRDRKTEKETDRARKRKPGFGLSLLCVKINNMAHPAIICCIYVDDEVVLFTVSFAYEHYVFCSKYADLTA